ncbi:hypothetical protein SCP_0601030 [Sparassis crispa]|uniref:Uncharacterized protein n=1 Tax=Sparassis crispa TaxID=139825 RepID=A0A401GPG7_9APHY|nr:hypothetical protein SCP_0601030 [Sparassis crispa]GBE84125.1 hypothetical protein SCP_0601030 [Sparassis crispa]
MVDWKDPEVIELTVFVLEQTIVFLVGFYGWHFLLTIHVEWNLLTRKLVFKWPYVPYLLGRYTMICCLLFVLIMSRLRVKEAHCRAMLDAESLVACMAVCCASMNLSIRTLTIWSCSMRIRFLLITLCLGHWAFAMVVAFTGLKAQYDAVSGTCVLANTNGIDRLAGFYAYTVGYDFIILVLTVYALYRSCKRSELLSVICVQGVWYFVVTFLVNIISVTLVLMDLNSAMSVLFSLPGVTISAIASSRCVLSVLSMADLFGRTREANGHTSWLSKLGLPAGEPVLLTTHITLNPSFPDVDSSTSDIDDERWSQEAFPDVHHADRSIPSAV